MKYFYSDNVKKHGPFSLEELLKEDLSDETLIWHEGLENWISAREIPELKIALEHSPPPIPLKATVDEATNAPDEEYTEDELFPAEADFRPQMFSRPFSFEGRIRRLEYGLSMIAHTVGYLILYTIMESGVAPVFLLGYIPLFWFLWAQGAKRCHDRGNSGWFQIIPFYGLWMIFAEGERGSNTHGLNPKA